METKLNTTNNEALLLQEHGGRKSQAPSADAIATAMLSGSVGRITSQASSRALQVPLGGGNVSSAQKGGKGGSIESQVREAIMELAAIVNLMQSNYMKMNAENGENEGKIQSVNVDIAKELHDKGMKQFSQFLEKLHKQHHMSHIMKIFKKVGLGTEIAGIVLGVVTLNPALVISSATMLTLDQTGAMDKLTGDIESSIRHTFPDMSKKDAAIFASVVAGISVGVTVGGASVGSVFATESAAAKIAEKAGIDIAEETAEEGAEEAARTAGDTAKDSAKIMGGNTLATLSQSGFWQKVMATVDFGKHSERDRAIISGLLAGLSSLIGSMAAANGGFGMMESAGTQGALAAASRAARTSSNSVVRGLLPVFERSADAQTYLTRAQNVAFAVQSGSQMAQGAFAIKMGTIMKRKAESQREYNEDQALSQFVQGLVQAFGKQMHSTESKQQQTVQSFKDLPEMLEAFARQSAPMAGTM